MTRETYLGSKLFTSQPNVEPILSSKLKSRAILNLEKKKALLGFLDDSKT